MSSHPINANRLPYQSKKWADMGTFNKCYTTLEFRPPDFSGYQGAKWEIMTPFRVVLSLLLNSLTPASSIIPDLFCITCMILTSNIFWTFSIRICGLFRHSKVSYWLNKSRQNVCSARATKTEIHWLLLKIDVSSVYEEPTI